MKYGFTSPMIGDRSFIIGDVHWKHVGSDGSQDFASMSWTVKDDFTYEDNVNEIEMKMTIIGHGNSILDAEKVIYEKIAKIMGKK